MSSRMNLFKVVIGVVLCGGGFACSSASPQPSLASQRQYSEGKHTENTIFKYLGRALYSTDKPVLIEYGGVCAKYYGSYAVGFPPIRLQSPLKGIKGLPAVREIFKKDKGVTVTETREGVIKISIGMVWIPMLQIKISRFALDSDEQYSPALAISAMMNTTEMRSAMARLQAQYPVGDFSFITSLARKGQPHLPPVMKDMTAGQILKSIAKTFKGIVTYSVCTQPDGKHLIDIGFAGRIADFSE